MAWGTRMMRGNTLFDPSLGKGTAGQERQAAGTRSPRTALRDSSRQLEGEYAAIAGDVAPRGGEDGHEVAQSAHAITSASPSVYLFAGIAADSDENSQRFRLKPATCSDGSQPVIPTKASRGGGANRERREWGQFAETSSSLLFFAARSFRSDSPLSSRRWPLWTKRSSTASAIVGSPM
jgi:hypothetical protein